MVVPPSRIISIKHINTFLKGLPWIPYDPLWFPMIVAGWHVLPVPRSCRPVPMGCGATTLQHDLHLEIQKPAVCGDFVSTRLGRSPKMAYPAVISWPLFLAISGWTGLLFYSGVINPHFMMRARQGLDKSQLSVRLVTCNNHWLIAYETVWKGYERLKGRVRNFEISDFRPQMATLPGTKRRMQFMCLKKRRSNYSPMVQMKPASFWKWMGRQQHIPIHRSCVPMWSTQRKSRKMWFWPTVAYPTWASLIPPSWVGSHWICIPWRRWRTTWWCTIGIAWSQCSNSGAPPKVAWSASAVWTMWSEWRNGPPIGWPYNSSARLGRDPRSSWMTTPPKAWKPRSGKIRLSSSMMAWWTWSSTLPLRTRRPTKSPFFRPWRPKTIDFQTRRTCMWCQWRVTMLRTPKHFCRKKTH